MHLVHWFDCVGKLGLEKHTSKQADCKIPVSLTGLLHLRLDYM